MLPLGSFPGKPGIWKRLEGGGGGSREVSQCTLLSRKWSVLSSSRDSHASYNRKKGANQETILLRVNQEVSHRVLDLLYKSSQAESQSFSKWVTKYLIFLGS